MDAGLAKALTRAASKQTYYTIRFLVDRERRDDAFRAYAYFRWVDDTLDAELPSDTSAREAEGVKRRAFLERQKSLLDRCLRGDVPLHANLHEAMLVDLVQHTGPASNALEAYLRNMMRVMDFDLRRRGHRISEAELSQYTSWLAVAVTEAMHYFLSGGTGAPEGETRYRAVSGAHVLHMLRDTYPDLRAGYINVPHEMLEAHSIGPEDVASEAYRAWVAGRVRIARACFEDGRTYFARVPSLRHRLAGLAYIARFEWLAEVLERDGYRVRQDYGRRKSLPAGLRMGWLAIRWLVWPTGRGASPPLGTPQGGAI